MTWFSAQPLSCVLWWLRQYKNMHSWCIGLKIRHQKGLVLARSCTPFKNSSRENPGSRFHPLIIYLVHFVFTFLFHSHVTPTRKSCRYRKVPPSIPPPPACGLLTVLHPPPRNVCPDRTRAFASTNSFAPNYHVTLAVFSAQLPDDPF
jgi:hypothetical protein